MYCKHCGNQLVDGARFCSNCCAPVDFDYNTGGGYNTNYLNQRNQISSTQGTPLAGYITKNKKTKWGCLPIVLIAFVVIVAFGVVNAFILDCIHEGNAIICESGTDLNYIKNEYSATITFGDGSVAQGYKIPAGVYKVKGTTGCTILGKYNLDGITKWREVGWLLFDNGNLQATWVDLYDIVGGNILYHNGEKADILTIEFPFDVFVTNVWGGKLMFIPQN